MHMYVVCVFRMIFFVVVVAASNVSIVAFLAVFDAPHSCAAAIIC